MKGYVHRERTLAAIGAAALIDALSPKGAAVPYARLAEFVLDEDELDDALDELQEIRLVEGDISHNGAVQLAERAR